MTIVQRISGFNNTEGGGLYCCIIRIMYLFCINTDINTDIKRGLSFSYYCIIRIIIYFV